MTNKQIKYIQSLHRQKYRKAHNAYIVEGSKNAKEWLQSKQKIKIIAALPDWLAKNTNYTQLQENSDVVPLKAAELQKISGLKTAQSVLLVVEIPQTKRTSPPLRQWCLFLEDIKDPGNMGTIIRIADWFGISNIFCSENCVEAYNPKVVQASMGSLSRINLQTCSLKTLYAWIDENKHPLYATDLKGRNFLKIQKETLIPGILAMGNESTGLSESLLNKSQFKLKIPSSGAAESLNVAVATGILCAWLTQ